MEWYVISIGKILHSLASMQLRPGVCKWELRLSFNIRSVFIGAKNITTEVSNEDETF
jgi:hypothetical protein